MRTVPVRQFKSSAGQHRVQVHNAGLLARTPPEHVVYAVIACNVGVFGLWQVKQLRNTMSTHFRLSYSHRRRGYWHTLLTHAVSHKSVSHLFSNMFTLFFFGTSVASAVGTARVRAPLQHAPVVHSHMLPVSVPCPLALWAAV